MPDFLESPYDYDLSGKITSTGSANAYVITQARQINGYYQGFTVKFKANFTNSGAATANVVTQSAPAGLGDVALRKAGGATALASGDIVSGGIYTLVHDGTNFQVQELNGVIAAGSVGTASIADDAVTNAKLANMAEATIKGRAVGAGTGDPTDLTATQATAILNAFTSALKGLVPASGGGTTTFLRADGTFAAPPSGITASTVQAATSESTVDFPSLPAGIKRITIIFDSVSLSGTDNVIVQIGDSGGLETTGYTSKSGNRATEVTSTAGFIWLFALAADLISGHMTLTRITGDTWVASLVGSSTGSREVIAGGGRKVLSADLDRLRVTVTGANTFDGSGQINILTEL